MAAILDFHITRGEGDTFRVEVHAREKGEKSQKSPNPTPLATTNFTYDLSFMTDFQVSQLDPVHPDQPEEIFQRRQDFGVKLYEKLFVPEVEKVWQEYKEANDFLVLCLRIAREAEKLEVLPWETLYDGREFIAAGSRTGLVRLPLDIAFSKSRPPLKKPVRMLALVSSPLDLKDHERLAVEQEQEVLLRATNSPAGQGRLQVDFEDEAKLPVIEGCLEKPYQIFHYSGHGIDSRSGGGLLLEDGEDKRRPTTVEEVLQILEKGVKHFRLAVLSGCRTARTLYSSGLQDMARGLARLKVPAVLAMQFSISEPGGMLLAESLYPRLVEGISLASAVSAARRTLLQSDDPVIRADALAPVLVLAAERPLKIKEDKKESTKQQTYEIKGIEFENYLPLPRLNFGFYGRRREYRALRDGVLYKNQRAIIIHGIGGIGKTALVSHTAVRLKEHFQGAYAFDCRAGGLAPETILLEIHRYLENMKIDALNPLLYRSLPPEQLAVYMSQVLTQVPLLIIFDNFETHLEPKEGKHIIADANLRVFLETLVKTTDKSSCFLFTSRYLFDIDEKRVGLIRNIALEDLSRAEALGMMQHLPHLSAYSYGEKLAALEVFGGHPYGLVTLDRHCGRKSLAEALKSVKEMHREMREFLAIEINYRKLSSRSRELLNRVAAFRRSMDWEALHWMMGKPVDSAADFFKQMGRKHLPKEMHGLSDEELISLFRKALPEKRRAEGLDESVRELVSWGLLTPIEEDGEVESLSVHSLVRDFCRERCLDTWKSYLKEAAAYYTNPSKQMAMEEKNLSIVLNEIEGAELLIEAEAYEPAADIILKVTELLSNWGMNRMTETLSQKLIPRVKLEIKADLIHNFAILLYQRGDYSNALEKCEESLNIFEEIGDRAGVAASLNQIGNIRHNCGEYGAALENYEKALKIKEELGDRLGVARFLNNIGAIYQNQGKYKIALAKHEKSLEVFEEIGDRAGVAASLHQIGRIHQDCDEYEAALEEYEKSRRINEEIGDRAGVARSLYQIGMIHHDQGEYEAALEKYEKSLKIKEEIGDLAGIANSLHQIGMIHQKLKEYPQALDLYLQALTVFAQLQSTDGGKTANILRELRSQWGEKEFDAAWLEKTGEEVPGVLKGESSPEPSPDSKS